MSKKKRRQLETNGRSTLYSQTGRLIGFGFVPHPLFDNCFLEVVFYKTPTEYVLCMSEGKGAGDPESQRAGLGDEVPGSAFAPYAQRSIEGKLSYDEFKKMMEETLPSSIPGMKLEWHA
jgi:hypothetical protein